MSSSFTSYWSSSQSSLYKSSPIINYNVDDICHCDNIVDCKSNVADAYYCSCCRLETDQQEQTKKLIDYLLDAERLLLNGDSMIGIGFHLLSISLLQSLFDNSPLDSNSVSLLFVYSQTASSPQLASTAANSNVSNNSGTGLPQINRILNQTSNRAQTPPTSVNHINRPARPQSTSSIPQIGNIPTSSVKKSSIAISKNKTSKLNDDKSTESSKICINSKSKLALASTRLNSSQIELNSKNSKSTSTPATSSAAKSNARLQLRRLPPPTSLNSSTSVTTTTTTRRPISTIIESSIPSLIMTTSCPNNTGNLSTNTNSTTMNHQAIHNSMSSITKPTATVKGT